ncbi:MAG: putative metal-binding motif-containing protein [Sinobacterium sp.]|nr:putative metal-binding motif-containing protein [Sinobacterium sp.]
MLKNSLKSAAIVAFLTVMLINLSACGGKNNSSAVANKEIVAFIENLGEVYEGDTITLEASLTEEMKALVATYAWAQVSGSAVSIEHADTATPTFTFPLLESEETMSFSLTITDEFGSEITLIKEIPVLTRAIVATQDADDAIQTNNSIETASAITEGVFVVKSISPIGDNDFLETRLTAGIKYEFFANRLCATCDVRIYLYDDEHTEVEDNDDYIDYDSRLTYTPTESATYYLQVRAYDEDFGLSKYTVGFHPFVDEDEDGYSSYYDCDETNDEIYPWAIEVLGDGIDQNCSGFDYLLSNLSDSFEDDDDIANAVTMVESKNAVWEIQFQHAQSANMRTLHDITDVDFFKIEMLANSALYIESVDSTGVRTYLLLDESGSALSENENFIIDDEEIENKSLTPQTILVKYTTTVEDGVTYIPTYVDLGFDLDGDGFYTKDWDSGRDCNDSDNTIFPYADDIDEDGIDSDCNGLDAAYEEDEESEPEI